MRLSLLILFWLTTVVCFSQKITLSARIQDKVSGEPLPFASIGIKGKSLGTISNLNGEFDFHIPAEDKNEILVVTMLGYQNFEAPIWSLLETPAKNILMEKSSTFLKELIVTDSLQGGEIIRIALSRIEQNFPMQPFMLDGFYRDVKKVGGRYIALLEAAVKVYDDNYTAPRNRMKLRERVKLIQVRKSLGYENKFTPYFGQNNLLEDLLLNNSIRYREIEEDDRAFKKMIRERDSYYNGHEVFVVQYTGDYKLKAFVDKDNFSFIHLDLETSESSDYISRKKNAVSKFISRTKSIDFKKYNDKMYLNYITVSYKEDWYDTSTDKLKFVTELIQHFMVNEIHADTNEKIGSTEKMRNYGLQYQDYPYDKDFWDNYNVLKDTPIDAQILEDLEKQLPLHQQFEIN